MIKIMCSLLLFGYLAAASANALPDWATEMRPSHPRLLVNDDILADIRRQAENGNRQAYQELKSYVYASFNFDELELYSERFSMQENGKIKLAPQFNQGPEIVRNTGCKEAAAAAMLYLISGDSADLALAIKYLQHANRYAEYCLQVDLPLDYHTEQIINFMCAYDWLYNELPTEERLKIGRNIAEYVKEMQPDGRLKVFKSNGEPHTGFYGVFSLMFPAGIVLYQTGVNDELAVEFLNKGYDLYRQAMEFRDEVAGDKGLLVASTPTYSFGAYPLATFLFFYMNKAALDKDVTLEYSHMQGFINWFLWATIPDGNGGFFHHGVGDVRHNNNRFDQSMIYSHFAQIANFYAESRPDVADKAAALIATLPPELKKFNNWHPFMPMMMTNFEPEKAPQSTIAELTATESGCFFPIFGLCFMRSGYSGDGTFAVFRSGNTSDMHQHYDENSFVIYRRGFQAVDTGTRLMAPHHIYYYPQSVAHNTILIDYPNEPMPGHWNHWPSNLDAEMIDADLTCDGGQYTRHNGKNRLFITKPEFTWVSGDATQSYRSEKCQMAQREFVYLPPHIFVVYDKVESTKSEYTKRFLLHTLKQPQAMPDSWFAADTGEGSELRWLTLLPLKAEKRLIGGPGQQFVSNHRNFPFPTGEAAFEQPNYYGAWRQEVVAPQTSAKAEFLHVLHAAVPEETWIKAENITENGRNGVKITVNEQLQYNVFFNAGRPGGYIEKLINAKAILREEI